MGAKSNKIFDLKQVIFWSLLRKCFVAGFGGDSCADYWIKVVEILI